MMEAAGGVLDTTGQERRLVVWSAPEPGWSYVSGVERNGADAGMSTFSKLLAVLVLQPATAY